tara:strand:- start:113 stop:472 length:360 start_codon:yes stop_codon:yes gene_type:complete
VKKIIFCFDLDNTICTTHKNNYEKSKPKKKIIQLINNLYENGHIIKILTARFMGRNNDNIKLATKKGYKKTHNQLVKWGLKFHKLKISKLSADIYIDDKSYGYNKKWVFEFEKYINNKK